MADKYIFDSNIFIGLQRRQPLDLYPSVWRTIGDLLEKGTICSSREVYDEIAVGTDDLSGWIKQHKSAFIETTEDVQRNARVILAKHRRLVEGGRKMNSADPFVIALAQLQGYPIVTDEKATHNPDSPKIPDVCNEMSISCMDFVTWMREMKLQF